MTNKGVRYYLKDLVVFAQEEADALLAGSKQNPWLDQGINETIGHGYVLSATHLSILPEGMIIPESVIGTHRWGLFIDGYLPDVLQHFRDIFGELRTWRAWPDSGFALIVPDLAYTVPMDDPVLERLAQAVSLQRAFHTLEALNLTFVDLYEGYLIVENEQRQFETWWMLPNWQGIDEDLSNLLPVVEYDSNLYSYGSTSFAKEEIYSRIQIEV